MNVIASCARGKKVGIFLFALACIFFGILALSPSAFAWPTDTEWRTVLNGGVSLTDPNNDAS